MGCVLCGVGSGFVGSQGEEEAQIFSGRLARCLLALGPNCVLCDPVRANQALEDKLVCPISLTLASSLLLPHQNSNETGHTRQDDD